MTHVDQKEASSHYAVNWQNAVEKPVGIRGQIRAAIRHATVSVSSLISHSQSDRFLRCLTCHYVFDDQRKQFETLIQALTGIGRFVDTSTCVRMLQGEAPIDGRYFHLSFDDGFRNVVTNAFPILSTYSVPAIFFVPTALIGAQWEEARFYCIETTKYRDVIQLASWQDLAELNRDLFEVGSHTKSHIRASHTSARLHELQEELTDSKKEIERRLGTDCKYLAWPFGKTGDVDQSSLLAAKTAGYSAAFSVERGSIRTGISDPFFLPRHHFEPQWPLSHILYFSRGNMERD